MDLKKMKMDVKYASARESQVLKRKCVSIKESRMKLVKPLYQLTAKVNVRVMKKERVLRSDVFHCVLQ
jgi:hypothetical protein